MREIRITYYESPSELTAITRRSEQIICTTNGDDVYVFSAGDDSWEVGVASSNFVTYEIREVSDQPDDPPTWTSKPTVRY